MLSKRSVGIAIVIVFLGSAAVFASSQEAMYKYNESGIQKLRQKDFQGAINDLKIAQSYDPSNQVVLNNLASAYNNYGFSLMQQGDLRFAVEKLERAAYYDKENPFIFYNLGLAHYKLQNIPKAKDYFQKAYRLNPDMKGLKDLIVKISSEVGVEKSFERLETMHFIVAYAKDLEIDQMSYIRTYLEEAYGRVGMFLDCYPESKTITLLYAEANYRHLLGNKPPWTMAVYDGKVRIPANKFNYTNMDVVKMIYHEYAHVLTREICGTRCPTWLNEGISSKAEDLVEPKDKDLIKRYLKNMGLVPMKNISNDFIKIKDGNMATLMYIESYLLVDFIVAKVGNRGLRSILEHIKHGTDVYRAIELVFKKKITDFEKEWERYIKDRYAILELNYIS